MTPTGRVAVIGHPGDRRALGFSAAARAAGWQVDVVPWRAAVGAVPLTDHHRRAITEADVVRVDSPGDDRAVDSALRGDHGAEPGELRSTARWHRGLVSALDRISNTGRAMPGRPAPCWVPPPAEVTVLFDKTATARRLARAGVAVAPWHERPDDRGPGSFGDVVAAATAIGTRRLFLKPRYGSSGAGVVAVELDRRGPTSTSGIDIDESGRLLYSTRIRRRRGAESIDLIDRLCALDEIRVERWYPKAGLDGRVVDLRVLVIGGEPRHAVVRAARGPITNLNLGGQRGDLAALEGAIGAHLGAVTDTCRRVAAEFPRCLHLGVDILVAPGFRDHVVGEVNAFGDLLPGLTHRGRSTFEAEVDALPLFLADQAAA